MNDYLKESKLKLFVKAPKTKRTAEWPKETIKRPKVEAFISQLVLAANQPNGENLKQKNLAIIRQLAPFSKRQVGEIFRIIENDRIIVWYIEEDGVWLTEDVARKWFGEASQQHDELINPLKKRELNPKWDDLKQRAQQHLLNTEVEFQGNKR